MIKGACHCGAVTFETTKKFNHFTECNCSICRKLGVIWGHGAEGDFDLKMATGATEHYIWGDKNIAFHRCRNCGCTTHWQCLESADRHISRMAVNMRLAEPAQIADINVRHLDGADTWEYLD